MLFDIFNVFPYYLHVNYWTGKSVRIFSRKQVISGNFRRFDVYSWVRTAARNKFTTANNEWYTANNVIPTIHKIKTNATINKCTTSNN